MAKGDQTGNAASPSGTAVPKQDQYSVMHALLNQGTQAPQTQWGMGNNGIAPSAQFNLPNSGVSGFGSNGNQPPQIGLGGNGNPVSGLPMPTGPVYGGNGGISGGNRIGTQPIGGNGPVISGDQGSLAPTNPNEFIRRIMMNQVRGGSFGGNGV